jgi:signal transduction histidine kinase/ActR/RegA family two-component response regulator
LTNDLASLLGQRRDRIVALFVAEVQRANLAPSDVGRSLLVDHIPTFLDEVIAGLTRASRARISLEVIGTSETARQHGKQRWSLGYDLDALLREYGILRHCVLEIAKEEGVAVSIDEFDLLAKCLSVGVAEAVNAYSAFRDEQVNAERSNLEFLAQAGQLLTSSLDFTSTLSRLTGLIVPNLADWCAVIVEGVPPDQTPVASVNPATGEALRDILRRFPPDADSDFGLSAALRTGASQLIEEVPAGTLERIARTPEHLALLRLLGPRSLIVVPLRVQSTVFGAITLAWAESPRRYGPADRTLLEELARRAAVAIDNAHLYASSQKERARVEAATRAKDEFVAVVSHELRTPLNAILGWIRLLRGGDLPDSKREHAFEIIERNANAQGKLVADLLDISRVITGKIRINPSQVDLAGVVDMVIEGMRPAAEAKRLRINVDLDTAGSLMRGDGDRLQQVVWNLLTNAVKYTPKNGVIDVTLRRVSSDIELVVQDSGEGISPHHLPHVFDNFHPVDSSPGRSHGGLGIGLSIARHLVELHGGSIEARSPGVGRGTTITVRLPVGPLVSTTFGVTRVPATAEQAVSKPLASGAEGVRVLVVDDEADARDLVAYVFESCGMQVRAAASAAEARTELQTFTPHVIVSDIGMPAEDGYALIRSIRALPADDKKGVPAIALTAFARSEDRTRALLAGFNVHMTKPVEPTALVQAVLDLAGHVRR